MRALIALTAAAAILAGCETVEGYRQQTEQWIGVHADTLLLERGSPDTRDRLSDGREVWIYSENEHHHLDGYTTTTPRTRVVRRRDKDGEIVEYTQTYYDREYQPPRDWWTECETRFVLGLNDRVEDFRFTGDGCVAAEIY